MRIIIDLSHNDSQEFIETPIMKKSLSFNDTIQAVDLKGDVEEIPITFMDERHNQRENELFMENESNNEDKLKIITNNSENISLDFETL